MTHQLSRIALVVAPGVILDAGRPLERPAEVVMADGPRRDAHHEKAVGIFWVDGSLFAV